MPMGIFMLAIGCILLSISIIFIFIVITIEIKNISAVFISSLHSPATCYNKY